MEVFHITDIIHVILGHISSYNRTQLATVNKIWQGLIADLGKQEPTHIEDQIKQACYYSYVRNKRYPNDITQLRKRNQVIKANGYMAHKAQSGRYCSDNLGYCRRSVDLVLASRDPHMIELIFKQIDLSPSFMLTTVCMRQCNTIIIQHFADNINQDRLYPMAHLSFNEQIPDFKEQVLATSTEDIQYLSAEEVEQQNDNPPEFREFFMTQVATKTHDNDWQYNRIFKFRYE